MYGCLNFFILLNIHYIITSTPAATHTSTWSKLIEFFNHIDFIASFNKMYAILTVLMQIISACSLQLSFKFKYHRLA